MAENTKKSDALVLKLRECHTLPFSKESEVFYFTVIKISVVMHLLLYIFYYFDKKGQVYLVKNCGWDFLSSIVRKKTIMHPCYVFYDFVANRDKNDSSNSLILVAFRNNE